jgi:hypothetical protein
MLNGQILYNAVWQPGTANDISIYGWTFADFMTEYDNLW